MDERVPRLARRLRDHDRCGELELALLFGSWATGGANAASDIDLALLARAPLSADFRVGLMRTLGEEFGLPVDLVDLYHAPEPVTGEALRGARLLGTDEAFAGLLIRHLDNVEDFVPLQRRMLAERRERWLR